MSGEWFDYHESARKLVQQPDPGNAEKLLVLSLLENLGWLLFERSNPKLMEINCPSCNEAVLIADEDMTTTIECPFCQQPIEFDEPNRRRLKMCHRRSSCRRLSVMKRGEC